MQEHQTCLILDKAAYFPHYEELETLYRQIFKTPMYSGYGVGGVLDDIITWVSWVCEEMQVRPDAVAQVNIPNLTSVGKRADRYQELFITVGINLCKIIPAGTHTMYPILCKGANISLYVFYYGASWHKHEYIDRLRLDLFRKALNRRRKLKSN